MTQQGTGFRFEVFQVGELLGALRRALAIHRQPGLWRALQRNGMAKDFSWRRSADGYDLLYAEALERVAAGRILTLDLVRAMV
jgi:starch synthase